MTAGELITKAIKATNAGTDLVDDSVLRDRYQNALQEVVNKAWTYRPETWRMVGIPGTVTFLANNNQATLPADFASAGGKMRVYLFGQKLEVVYEPPEKFFRRVELQSTKTSRRPLFYTLQGEAAGGLKYIWVYPTAAISITLDIQSYVRKPPTLVDRPTAPTLTADVAAGNPNGTYTYRVTFVTATGETEGGTVSAPITVASKKIDLSSIPVAAFIGSDAVTARKLYRTTGTGVQHLLLATLSDNLTTTYQDNIADGSLGAAVPTPSTAITGLEQIPDQHHQTLVFDAMLQRLARNQGDGRSAGEFTVETVRAMTQMWAEENIHHVRRRAPRYGSRYRW